MKRILLILTIATLACGQGTPLLPGLQAAPATPRPSRAEGIPSSAHKMTPVEDTWPPIAAAGLGKPEPLPFPINTAGGEDSPFITLDDQFLYFFFTPDVHIPTEKQLLDGLTGIWMSHHTKQNWSEPQRIMLEKPGELALDGCEFVLHDWMVFCSARAGNFREVDLYTAAMKNGAWTDVKNWGKQMNQDYEIGEMHISADGQELYFGSSRAGGYGKLDLWMSQMTPDGWGKPINLGPQINTAADEGWPYISPNGKTLWYTSMSSQKGLPGPAIFRSTRNSDGAWSKPVEMISQFAGEPSLSADGHILYFVHHYYSADLKEMIEADIYVVSIP